MVGPSVGTVFDTIDEAQPEALRLLAGLRAQADDLVACLERAWALSPVEKVRAVEQLARVRRTADAAHLALVRSLSPADAAELGGTSVAGLLSWRLRIPHGRAKADVEAARVTDPDTGELRRLGAALAAGDVSTGHVDAARRTLDHLPDSLRAEHAASIDAFLADQSRQFRPGVCEHLAARVLDRVDPTREDRGFDVDDFARRFLDITTDTTGMVVLRGQLGPVEGAQLKAAIDHFAKPVPATTATAVDGQTSVPLADDRTPRQRRADALGVVARQGLAGAGVRGGEPPRITVTATTDQLAGEPGAGRATCEQTGPLSAVALRRLRCDAALSAVLLAPSGAVLDLGRTVRCATPAQRRALLARDGGCVIPGCDVPSAQLEAHHVTAWAAGGLTDVDQMVLASVRTTRWSSWAPGRCAWSAESPRCERRGGSTPTGTGSTRRGAPLNGGPGPSASSSPSASAAPTPPTHPAPTRADRRSRTGAPVRGPRQPAAAVPASTSSAARRPEAMHAGRPTPS